MGCGNVCPRPLANATVTCGPAKDPVTGEEVRGCAMLCDDDYDDCNGDPLDGCEVRTTGNDTNCGFCGVDCTDDTPPKICKNCKCRTADEPATSCDAVRTAKLIRAR
jgi:hypothetical protein